VLEQAAAFYQEQLDRYPEARHYLEQRGLHDAALIQQLRIGYAPGGSLRRHLTVQGYSFDFLQRVGLLNSQGRDTFCGRVVFPCCLDGRIVNLYGRSLGDTLPIDSCPAPRVACMPGSRCANVPK
jgi:DNA primase